MGMYWPKSVRLPSQKKKFKKRKKKKVLYDRKKYFSFCAGWSKIMLFNIINWENRDKKETLNLIAQSSRCNPNNVPFKINALMLLMSRVGGKEKSQLCVCVCVGACLTHPYAVYFSICSKDTLMTSTVGNHSHNFSYETSQKMDAIRVAAPFEKTQSTVFRILSKIAVEIWESRTGHQCLPAASLACFFLSEIEMVWRTAGVPKSKSLSGKVCRSPKRTLFKSCTFLKFISINEAWSEINMFSQPP